MKNLLRIRIYCGAAAAGLVICAAQAQSPPAQIALCKQVNGETSLAACTAIIQGGRSQGAELSSVYFARGMVHDSLKQYDLAVKDYQLSFVASHENQEAPYNRTVACNYLVLRLNTAPANDAEAYEICGGAYNDASQYARALQVLDQAIKLKPDFARAYQDRGVSYLNTDQKDRALQEFDQAIKLAPASEPAILGDVLRLRGQLRAAMSQYALAVQDFDQLKKLRTDNPDILNEGCWTRAIWGQELDKALTDCNASLRLRPNSASTLDSRGLVNFRLGKYSQAVADYDAAITLNGSYAGSHYVRGLAKLKMGDKTGGDQDVSRAKEMSNKVVSQYDAYGVRP